MTNLSKLAESFLYRYARLYASHGKLSKKKKWCYRFKECDRWLILHGLCFSFPWISFPQNCRRDLINFMELSPMMFMGMENIRNPWALPSKTEINGFQLGSHDNRCGIITRQLWATILEKIQVIFCFRWANILIIVACCSNAQCTWKTLSDKLNSRVGPGIRK